jgi:hypothetical protein
MSLPAPMKCSPRFSSNNCIISCVTFKYYIHSSLFLGRIRNRRSSFIVLYVSIQFFQHNLLKSVSFFQCIFLSDRFKNQLAVNVVVSGHSVTFSFVCVFNP